MDETEKNGVEESIPEKPCKLCEMEAINIAVAAARGACSTIEDPEQRDDCKTWASGIDGDNYKNAKDILKDAIRRSGPVGINVTPMLYNAMTRQAVVEVVDEDVAWNEAHPDDLHEIDPVLLDHYKKYAADAMTE